jgi:hypothetical protein
LFWQQMESPWSEMIHYTPPSVDNLVNNLPGVLKSSRQFLTWNVEAGGKKVPLKKDGSSWGSYQDPNCWRTFGNAIDLLGQRRTFGIGLVLPTPQQIETLPEFNLIPGLLAIDADAKRSPSATPYNVPESIFGYVRSVQSYTEFSPSLKGLRSLVFARIPTDKQNITKTFGDGTEFSLYRAGWVTLSGLRCGNSFPRIEHRQEAIDQIVEELWPSLRVGTTSGTKSPTGAAVGIASFQDSLVLDWSRTASEDLIRQFIQGWNRTPKQLERIRATWELRRPWNHGDTPNQSLYTKRIVEESLWLALRFGWTLQDVIDIVITFCRKRGLRWGLGRAKRQIADGLAYISTKTCQRSVRCGNVFERLIPPQHPPSLTCKDSQIIKAQNRSSESQSSAFAINGLLTDGGINSRDTLSDGAALNLPSKVSQGFKHKSAKRDAVLQMIEKYRGWVKPRTVATQTGVGVGATKKQLQRLKQDGLVDGDGKGHYRLHKRRQHRKLKPCSEKPIPKCRGMEEERKTLSRTELVKRGWPTALIDEVFLATGCHYQKQITVDSLARPVSARLYPVDRIKETERETGFEKRRADYLAADRGR